MENALNLFLLVRFSFSKSISLVDAKGESPLWCGNEGCARNGVQKRGRSDCEGVGGRGGLIVKEGGEEEDDLCE